MYGVCATSSAEQVSTRRLRVVKYRGSSHGTNEYPFKIGDRVAFRLAHRSHAIENAASCYPIPDSIPFEHAVWFALAKIAFAGLVAAVTAAA